MQATAPQDSAERSEEPASSRLPATACSLSSISSVEDEENAEREITEWLEALRTDKSLKSIWEYMAFLLDWKFRENGIGRAVYSESDNIQSFTLYFGNTHITLQAVEEVPSKAIFVGKYGILNKRDFVDRIDRKVGVMVKAHEALIAARQKREETIKVREAIAMRSKENRPNVPSDTVSEHGAFADDCGPVSHNGDSSDSLANEQRARGRS